MFHMVRILTGTLVEVGLGVRRPEEIAAILDGKRPAEGGNAGTGVRTLPDGGLLSVEDLYEKDMESTGTQSFCRG